MEPKSETQPPLREKNGLSQRQNTQTQVKECCMVKREECFKREQAKESYLMTLILVITNNGLLSCFH